MFSCSGYIYCFVQIIFSIFNAMPLVLGLRFSDLILIFEVNSELCPLFQAESFAKVVIDLELLSVFPELFVLHYWWSSESASTHCNLLVSCGYLLLLLLLDLDVVCISCLFKLTTITSVQHSTELCPKIVVLTLRGKDRWVYLFRYCSPFSCQCFSCAETFQLICVANRVTA